MANRCKRGQLAINRTSFANCHRAQVATQRPIASYGHSHKGQVATEFFIYAGIFLILVIAAAAVVNFTQSAELNLLEANVAKENGQLFSDAVHLSLRGGTNFTYMLDYPKNILGYPYFVEFDGAHGLVFINWNNPKGNFSYVYSTTPFSAEFNICPLYQSQKANKLSSVVGVNQLNITNDGSKLIISQKCS